MGSNRDIKSDGAINISSTQTNISGDLDVTGSINNFSFPGSDGIAGQALTTNGSGTLSFSDVSGGGAGGINYITNTRATTDTTGYATYADAAATTPADGTGGSANITFTRNTTTPLRDGGDFKIAKDAANRQGEGVGYAFTIDNADKARKMLISFDYDASDSDYADDDIKIFVYDVTNTNLIRVNGEDLKGGKGKHYAQFQTAADSTSYRLIFHVSSTNASAYDVFLDEISVGPQNISHGTIITDWESYTPTLTNLTLGNGGQEWSYRRVGSDIEITGEVYLGSTSSVSGNIIFSLPSGYSLDLTKYADSNDSAVKVFGEAVPRTGSGTLDTYSVYSSSSDSFLIQGMRNDNTTDTWNATFPIGWGTGHIFNVRIKAPILGWSSNAKMSEEFSGADVKANAELTSAVTLAASSGTQTPIIFNSEEIDSAASYNNSTGEFTVPESGRYLITAQVDTTGLSDWVEGDFLKIGIEKNGVGRHYERVVEIQEVPSQAVVLAPNLSVADDFVKGDVINVNIDAKYGGSGTLQATGGYLSVTKLATAQTQLENETVACKAFVNADYTKSDSNSHTIQFNEVAYDTHGGFDTSTYTYTFPVSGYYLVHANVAFTSFTGFANARISDGGSSHAYVYFGANDDEVAGVTLTYMNYYSKGDSTKVYMDPQGITEDASYQVEGNATMGGTLVSHISIARIK